MNVDSKFSFSNNSNSECRNLRETVNKVLQDILPTTSNFSYLQSIEVTHRYHEMQPRQPYHQPSIQPARYNPYDFGRPTRYLPTHLMTVLGPEIAKI